MNICCLLDGWPPNSRSRAILCDFPCLRLCSFYQSDLGVYFHIFEVQDHNNDIINTAMLTIDHQIQGRTLFCVTFQIRLGSFCQRDPGVYFHIFEVQDHNDDIINTAMLTIDLQIQGHQLFFVTFHVSGWVNRAIREILVFISTYLRSRITLVSKRRIWKIWLTRVV